jgi:NAD(P)-dependent dehydrogenase (short-subunit alcohol dehydrogenase family)
MNPIPTGETAGSMEGKVALVTGAAGGIGRASAEAFGARGAAVACLDIDRDGGEKTAAAIAEHGGSAAFFPCDVADEAQVEQAIAATVERFGRLDYAHNNAGVEGPVVPLTEVSRADWDRLLSINLTGVWLCMRAEIPLLLETGGAIVNTASASGLVARPGGIAAYVATKHGVIGLTKGAAVDYSAAGLRVNAVCPGPIATPFIEDLADDVKEMLLSLTPIHRFAEPEEVGRVVAWLCSEEASFMTGAAVAVDGGVTAF